MNAYISFDFESIYGVWDAVNDEYFESNVKYCFKNLKKIIHIHEKYDLKLNIAVVGLLFSNNKNYDKFFYLNRESKKEKFLLLKNKFSSITSLDSEILKILASKKVQLISHTYFHNYLNNENNNELVNKELEMINDLVTEGFLKKGIVFPKNQASNFAVESFFNQGYVLRLNFNNPLYSNNYNNFIRILRYLDSFLPITEFLNIFFENERKRKNLIEGGIFFRPIFRFRILEIIHFKRIILHYYYCYYFKKTFHIWSHPHNFGNGLDSIKNYTHLLNFIKKKQIKLKYFITNE
jgi:hypothetical protein